MPALETVASVIEVAAAVRELTRDGVIDKTGATRVVDALRVIYFTPNATMHLLDQIAQGQTPPLDEIEAILPAFNDKEWAVASHLRELDYDRLVQEGHLSLRQCRVLSEIGYGKRNLRASIQSFLNEPLTRGRAPRRQEATRLLTEIRALNALIEDIEENLRK